ncbi:hypothetical protein A2335_00265 [Candidatus Peregrinibacteria bacterium RIFOXYB2_FULL_32_7]|nr:MAG: hypothetical protein A2335_00265 [Candidatus Peregrinibacteria bacterium RIFOXYB2_FULL_32_7]
MDFPFQNLQSQISIITGSNSDWKQIMPGIEILKNLAIPKDKIEAGVASAHRIPKVMHAVIDSADEKNFPVVIITAAGASAHLQGTFASQTIKPVIGITVKGSIMNGCDAFLSQIRMPGGCPLSVAPGNGEQSARNSVLAALSNLGVKDKFYLEKLAKFYAVPLPASKNPKINIYAKKHLEIIKNQLAEFEYFDFEIKETHADLLNNPLLSIIEVCGQEEMEQIEHGIKEYQNQHLGPILLYFDELDDEKMIHLHQKFVANFDTHAVLISFGKAGAENAALQALRIIGNGDNEMSSKLKTFAKKQSQKVLETSAEFKY